MELLLTLLGILIFFAIISIICGIVMLIATKGKTGLKYILGGVIGIVIGIIIGLGTCISIFNGNIK